MLSMSTAESLGLPAGDYSLGGLFLLILAVGLFMLANSAIKSLKNRKHKKEVDAMQLGDLVTTYGGITGTVIARRHGTVEIEMTEESRVRYMDWAIAEVKKPGAAQN